MRWAVLWGSASFRAMRPPSLAVYIVILSACGSSDSGSRAASSSTEPSGPSISSSGSPGSADATGFSEAETSAATTAVPTTGGVDDGPELGVCGRLIDCATALQQPLSGIVGSYGGTGSCWDEFDPSVCWSDCRAAIRGLHETSPGAVECLECAVDADCSFWDNTRVCTLDNECAESAPCIPWEAKLQDCCEGVESSFLCSAFNANPDGPPPVLLCPASDDGCGDLAVQSMTCALALSCNDFLYWLHECHGDYELCGSYGDSNFIGDDPPDPYNGNCLEETRAYQMCADG